ncbi:hypothetical protein [Legionella longbeachae]|uniref:Uncharacterized protein n=1 Tax=Legionella longbeachae serogroup 1 (strain NSW150) TaxID=661367 RepID=D3HTQ4_LEGLN|nr:hypothetical protein [Legionella longbeachae]VEE02811.1 Uncharacterised protein [Legionella oakridgensis]HBD7397989.1 hypothetical protein [Legionella pneumophila]ARB90942.1 hypothetical protein A6J40_01455 [Legionella longbeachae]ARM32628.1 hypothetical protein B0B39_03455 [Legionella longbeachae]QIN32559.1 hypothetical protein GCB94_10620 [Legionella longbeachae]
MSIFEIRSNIAESLSRDVLENNQQTLPQKLFRVLDVILSLLEMLANTYGEQFCKITKAKQQGVYVKELDSFMISEAMFSIMENFLLKRNPPFLYFLFR